MTKETILTIEDIRIAALAAGCQLNVDDGALALHLSRAIEQYVLQSPEIQALQKDAERYRWLRDTLHNAKAGGGVKVNDALQVYDTPVQGEEVCVYWYQDTPVGFYQSEATTLDGAIDAVMEQNND